MTPLLPDQPTGPYLDSSGSGLIRADDHRSYVTDPHLTPYGRLELAVVLFILRIVRKA